MTATEGISGRGRITVFSLFGPVFAYTTKPVHGRQVACIGPLTPDVHWRKLWQMSQKCNVPAAKEARHAEWIITQATRALTCGTGVIVRLSDADWGLESGGRLVDLEQSWAHQDTLITGNLTVPQLTAEQVAERFTYYPQYA